MCHIAEIMGIILFGIRINVWVTPIIPERSFTESLNVTQIIKDAHIYRDAGGLMSATDKHLDIQYDEICLSWID